MGRQMGKRHRHRRKACTRKKRLTRIEAGAIAWRVGMDAYKCGSCGWWHVAKARRRLGPSDYMDPTSTPKHE